MNAFITRAICAYYDRFGVPPTDSWHGRLFAWHLRRVRLGFLPYIAAAQETTDAGLEGVWADPGTSIHEMMAWFDAQIQQTHAAPIVALDLVRVAVLHCDEAVWNAAQANGTLNLPGSAMIGNWVGHRTAWISEGRAVIEAAIPQDHAGLYLVLRAAGAGLTTAFSQRSFDV